MNMKKDGFIKIPSQIQIGGTTFDIEYVDRTGGTSMGNTNYTTTKLTIANNVDTSIASDSSKQATFFHELVHAILGELGEYELNDNERFVQSFSTILNHVTQQLINENC